MLPFLASIYWNVNPIIAHIGPLTLRWYGLFFMLPFVVGTDGIDVPVNGGEERQHTQQK